MTATAILSNGAELEKPSKASPPVRSAILWATGWMPPPVIEATRGRSSDGVISRGPPQPPRPLVTLTDLYSVMSLVSLRWALVAGLVQAEAGEVGDDDGDRTREESRHQHRGDTDPTVFSSASPRARPTGMKSQPTWVSIAN